MITKPQQLILLDQSAMKHSHCMRKLYWTLIKGYKLPLISQEIAFGLAFHTFVKELEETKGNLDEASSIAIKQYRNMKYGPSEYGRKYLTDISLALVCQEYFEGPYKNDPFDTLLDVDGKPIVEKRFLIDLYESDVVSIKLTGTIDRLMIHRTSGLLAIDDFKTSSAWNLREYLDKYAVNCQLMVYTWALKHLMDNCDKSSIFYKLKNKTIASFIDGVFVSSGASTGASCKVEFKRSNMMQFDSAQQLAETYERMQAICEKIDSLIRGLDVDLLIPSREGVFNGTCFNCQFIKACSSESDYVIRQHILDNYFIVKDYNPLEHGE